MFADHARLSLVLALALLQCLAPLLHGHVGASPTHGLHLHVSAGLHGAHEHGRGIPKLEDGTRHAAIGVPVSYKRDVSLSPMPMAQDRVIIASANPAFAWHPLAVVPIDPAAPSHLRPFATAPPAAAA